VEKRAQAEAEAGRAEAEGRQAAARASEVEAQLKVFASLDQDLREQVALQDRHAEDHQAHLGARGLAGQVEARRLVLEQAMAAEAAAEGQVRGAGEALAAAGKDFDPAALEQAREAATAAERQFAVDQRELESAETQLQRERERYREWQEASAAREGIERELGRLQAAGEIARLAGKVLRAAAPAVAQHICSRIAANAQRIFNRINQEPIELEWKAEPQYSLRIVPGGRRFSMLSGGEQTKLAVAMTLAMIQEFSGLRFAIFDEPTYAVDAESRPKLAEAILEAQKAAGLDQLIIVSHDDAFEGRIDNVVVVRKQAGRGTELAGEGGVAAVTEGT
jgi:DNA repair protein SbcC/Rad50